jgi:hypothetical protein
MAGKHTSLCTMSQTEERWVAMCCEGAMVLVVRWKGCVRLYAASMTRNMFHKTQGGWILWYLSVFVIKMQQRVKATLRTKNWSCIIEKGDMKWNLKFFIAFNSWHLQHSKPQS